MVAGVLRFCWQDDILGGPSGRRRTAFTPVRRRDLPL